MGKTIITAAINGSRVMKTMNQNVPVSVEEIVEDAYQCFLSGASIIHIHARQHVSSLPIIDLDLFNEIKSKIREKCDVILNFSTSGEMNGIHDLKVIGSLDSTQSKRIEVLASFPDIATIDLSTTNFGDRIFLNPTPFLNHLLEKMVSHHIKPEFEIFNPGDIEFAKKLIAQYQVEQPPLFQFALGLQGGVEATVEDLLFLKNKLPPDAIWTAFGISKNHMKILYATLAAGGHVRVGLEDNLYYQKGCLTNNVELVKRASRVIREFGNEVASVQETKAILKL